MKRTKIGQGYHRSGYYKGYNARPIIYRIDGKFYAKHKAAWNTACSRLGGDLTGYVEVRKFASLHTNKVDYYQK